MMHHSRTYAVSVVDDRDTLAEKLTQHDWTGCTGFLTPAGTLWLNDAYSPDGAQEYAVWRKTGEGGTYQQVESITASWSTTARIAQYATTADAGGWDDLPKLDTSPPEWGPAEEHDACPLCM